jgi:hypothetical protein
MGVRGACQPASFLPRGRQQNRWRTRTWLSSLPDCHGDRLAPAGTTLTRLGPSGPISASSHYADRPARMQSRRRAGGRATRTSGPGTDAPLWGNNTRVASRVGGGPARRPGPAGPSCTPTAAAAGSKGPWSLTRSLAAGGVRPARGSGPRRGTSRRSASAGRRASPTLPRAGLGQRTSPAGRGTPLVCLPRRSQPRQPGARRPVRREALCGPGDRGGPVVTVRLPDEHGPQHGGNGVARARLARRTADFSPRP